MKKEAIDKIRDKVKGRIVGVMSHGNSIEQLEQNIKQYKDYDICWTSFNLASIMSYFILNKIDKSLEIILKCAASTSKRYEQHVRIPMIKILIKKGVLVLSTWNLMKTQFVEMGIHDFYLQNKDKLILVDDLFGRLDGTPNSLFLLICSVAIGEPKRIILFGVDGYEKKNGDEFSTYYKPKLQEERRTALLGHDKHRSLHHTTKAFEERFGFLYKDFCKRCDVKPPEIINCSPNSKYKIFKTINYEQLPEYLTTKN